jgi:hypothetical protein
MRQAFAATALLLAATSLAHAAGYSVPTLIDGTTPDLRGIWQARGTAYVNIEGHRGGAGVAAARSSIVDPADGRIPYKSAALAKRDENQRDRAQRDPAHLCYQAGVPRAVLLPRPFQIVQSPGNLAIVYEDSHAYRIVYPDSRPHYTGVDWWMGDSRGHWEGNVLVVDVTTQNDYTWLDAAGNHHTNNIHVVERYTRTAPDRMSYEATIDDSAVYTRAWTLRTTLYRDTRPGARIREDECIEDEFGVRRRISPADPHNLLINDYRRWQQPAAAAAAVAPAATAPAPIASASAIPRLPDGKPDFQGNWFRRSLYGPTGFNPAAGGNDANFSARAGGGGPNQRDGDLRVIQGATVPYLPEALAEAKWRKTNQYLDGEPRCHLAGVPRAHEQPPYPHLIIQDEKYLTILYEYVHEPRIIPLDGSAHPQNYTAWDGDSRGHWEGDTLVVDVRNFNGRVWLDMVGNFVDENLHVIERYRLLDADHYEYQVTLEDPTVFSRPWSYKITVLRQPGKDQILEYGCLEGEGDLANYADVRAAELAARADEHAIRGCLRGQPGGDYQLLVGKGRKVQVVPVAGIKDQLPALLDREVRFGGQWRGDGQRAFSAESARAIAEGCTAGKW